MFTVSDVVPHSVVFLAWLNTQVSGWEAGEGSHSSHGNVEQVRI